MAAKSHWTKEEETASHGHFDPRPVLMIHFPGQQSSVNVTAPFEEIRIHEIIEHLLRGQEPGFDKALLAGDGEFARCRKPRRTGRTRSSAQSG